MSTALCTLSMREIVDITAQAFGLSAIDLTSPRRDARIVEARQAAAYLIRDLLPRSYPEIGRALGGRDHTTIMAACEGAERRLAVDKAYAGKVEALRAYCLPARTLDRPDRSPFDAAERILRSPREATGVSIETIRDLAGIAVSALQEASRQEAARARQLAQRVAAAEPPPAETEIEALRAALAEAERKLEVLAATPHPLAQPLREWTAAAMAAEAASARGQRAAVARVEKAARALQHAAEKHFNIVRKTK